MRIIPVLDVKSGIAVHAIGGDRANYRPLVTPWAKSSDPCEVARGVVRRFGWSTFYLADLDAIAGAEPAWSLFRDLHRRSIRLWVDAGMRTVADFRRMHEAPIDVVVAGLETLHGPGELASAIGTCGPDRIVFSLDLKGGRPLGNAAAWGKSPREIAACAVDCGIQRMILLDLERVGSDRGPGTESFLAELVTAFPHLELIVGGGIRGMDDVQRLTGASAVLVGSAIHDGRIIPRN